MVQGPGRQSPVPGPVPLTPNSPEDTEAICENCIWHHDWEGLLRTAPCNPTSWAGSVQTELLATGISSPLFKPAASYTPFPFCAAIMMVRDEADIIGANLSWLHHIGVRRFMILDNGSRDATRAILATFGAGHSDTELLVVEDSTIEYLQAAKTTALCDLACTTWPGLRWLLPIDADEFLIVEHGLQALAYVPDTIHALTIPKAIHFYPAGTTIPGGPIQLGAMSIRSHIFAVPPKIIFRATPGLGVTPGNHKVAGDSIAYASGLRHGFYYREFQTRSFAQFLTKVRNGGPAILAARAQGHNAGGEHWLGWYDTLQRGGEDALQEAFVEVAFRKNGPGYWHDPFEGRQGLLF